MKRLSHGCYVTAKGFVRAHPVQTLRTFYVEEMGMDPELADVARRSFTACDAWVLNVGCGRRADRPPEHGMRIAEEHRTSMATVLSTDEEVVVDGFVYRVTVYDEGWEEPFTLERLHEVVVEHEAPVPPA